VDAATAALCRFRVFFLGIVASFVRSVCFGFGSVRFGFDYVKAKKPPNICASNHMPACPAALRKAVWENFGEDPKKVGKLWILFSERGRSS